MQTCIIAAFVLLVHIYIYIFHVARKFCVNKNESYLLFGFVWLLCYVNGVHKMKKKKKIHKIISYVEFWLTAAAGG